MEIREIFSPEAVRGCGLEYNNGVVKTFSKTGYMRNYLGAIDERFVNEIPCDDGAIMDVGCGMGAVLGRLIQRGTKNIVGIDLDIQQLKVVNTLLKPLLFEHRSVFVELICDALPSLPSIGEKKFSAILCGQVLQYLRPTEFTIAIARLHQLLKIGGRLYITVMSHKGKKYIGFAEEYEKRKIAGEMFPGYMENPSRYHKLGVQHNPGFFLCFDPEVLSNYVSRAGFRVIEASYVDDASNKESLTGLIAVKD